MKHCSDPFPILQTASFFRYPKPDIVLIVKRKILSKGLLQIRISCPVDLHIERIDRLSSFAHPVCYEMIKQRRGVISVYSF